MNDENKNAIETTLKLLTDQITAKDSQIEQQNQRIKELLNIIENIDTCLIDARQLIQRKVKID